MSDDQVVSKQRLKWLMSRKLGSSDIAGALGLSSFESPPKVYDKIVARLDGDTASVLAWEAEAGNDIKRGQRLEPIAIEEYEAATGRKVHTPTAQNRHPEHGFITANPDGYVEKEGQGEGDPVELLLEAKVPRSDNWRRYVDYGIPNDWVIQTAVQLACHPTATEVDLFMFNADTWEHRIWRLDGGGEAFQKVVVEAAAKWWHRYIDNRERPPMEVEEAEPLVVPDNGGEVKVLDDPTDPLYDGAVRAIQAYYWNKRYEATYDKLKAAVVEDMQSRGLEAIEVPGEGKIRAAAQAGRSYWDKDALAELISKQGLDVDDYKKQGRPFLSVRVYPANNPKEGV